LIPTGRGDPHGGVVLAGSMASDEVRERRTAAR
jgi:hypothetical protein